MFFLIDFAWFHIHVAVADDMDTTGISIMNI